MARRPEGPRLTVRVWLGGQQTLCCCFSQTRLASLSTPSRYWRTGPSRLVWLSRARSRVKAGQSLQARQSQEEGRSVCWRSSPSPQSATSPACWQPPASVSLQPPSQPQRVPPVGVKKYLWPGPAQSCTHLTTIRSELSCLAVSASPLSRRYPHTGPSPRPTPCPGSRTSSPHSGPAGSRCPAPP